VIRERGLRVEAAMKLPVTQMTFDAPADEVFDFLADVENERGWNPELIEVRRCDADALGAGSEWDGTYKGMGVMHIRLDEYERPARLGFTTTGSRIDMQIAFTFTQDGSRTVARVDGEMEPKGVMRLLRPLMPPMMKRTFSRRPGQIADGLAAHRGRRAASA
jgi:uncharacterized protein YndB with AHSA1/START domain